MNSPNDRLIRVEYYSKPRVLHEILSGTDAVSVPDGNICFFCCNWQEGKCPLQESCPLNGHNKFALTKSSTTKEISDGITEMLKNSRQRAV